jgi:hypothetical protein
VLAYAVTTLGFPRATILALVMVMSFLSMITIPFMGAWSDKIGRPKITAIGDSGVVKDSSMTVNLYHLLDNTHADTNLLIYFPASKILTQVDVYMPNDARHIIEGEPLGHAPWNRNVMENIKHRKIQVDTHAPLHGDVVPWSKFVEDTIAMTQFLPGQAPEGGGRGAGPGQ